MDTVAPERWTERQAIVVVFVAIGSLLIGGIVGYGMATPNTAHAAEPVAGVSAKVVDAAKAEALAKAPSAAVVTKVTDLGGGKLEVTTAALQAPPYIYPPHGDVGNCWGHWMGDANLYLSGQHVAMVRAFFTGAVNLVTGQTNAPADQNKGCVSTVQTRPFWDHNWPGGLASKLQTVEGYIWGPHTASRRFSGPTASGPNMPGTCKEGHGSVYISGHGYVAGKVRFHC